MSATVVGQKVYVRTETDAGPDCLQKEYSFRYREAIVAYHDDRNGTVDVVLEDDGEEDSGGSNSDVNGVPLHLLWVSPLQGGDALTRPGGVGYIGEGIGLLQFAVGECEQLRQSGNDCFKQGAVEEAALLYSRAVWIVTEALGRFDRSNAGGALSQEYVAAVGDAVIYLTEKGDRHRALVSDADRAARTVDLVLLEDDTDGRDEISGVPQSAVSRDLGDDAEGARQALLVQRRGCAMNLARCILKAGRKDDLPYAYDMCTLPIREKDATGQLLKAVFLRAKISVERNDFKAAARDIKYVASAGSREQQADAAALEAALERRKADRLKSNRRLVNEMCKYMDKAGVGDV